MVHVPFYNIFYFIYFVHIKSSVNYFYKFIMIYYSHFVRVVFHSQEFIYKSLTNLLSTSYAVFLYLLKVNIRRIKVVIVNFWTAVITLIKTVQRKTTKIAVKNRPNSNEPPPPPPLPPPPLRRLETFAGRAVTPVLA